MSDSDTEQIRDALEAAYIERGDDASNLNEYELFAYTSEIPDGVEDETAIQVAAEVIADPPEAVNEETAADDTTGWFDFDFTASEVGWPADIREYDGWMTHKGDKKPWAPWTDFDAPAPCSKSDHTTAAECECSARWKWGWDGNHRSFEKAKMCLTDSRVDGLVYIQREDDPFVFVDGDDVRCPDTGEVHPAFVAILSHLGVTYADISVSGAGVHAYYRGDLPEDETVATWQLDDDPWGGNDDLPAIEIYSGKHVCVTTGKQVPGTPSDVVPWDSEVVWTLLEANDEFTNEDYLDSLADVDVDIGGCSDDSNPSPPPESGDGTTPEDCIRALNRLDAADVADETIVSEWTGSSTTGKAFLPVWGSSGDGGTANFVDKDYWVDTGTQDGHGGPIEMALIDMGELSHYQSEIGYASGSDFWKGYEHLRGLGFNLPEPPYAGDSDSDAASDYYDVSLDDYVDGDPWSDPDAMLEACLNAREDGAVAEDAEPPTLALIPIVRDLLGSETVGAETQEMATAVYIEEMGADDFKDGKVLI